MQRTKVVLVLTLAFVVALMTAMGVASAKPAVKDDSKKKPSSALKDSAKLRRAVDPAGILVHERRFQRIANANEGTRASGTPGYDASADYVANKLRGAGYKVEVQPFTFPYFEVVNQSFSQTTPQQRDFEPYDPAENTGDYFVMVYSGSGTVEDTQVVPTSDVQIPPPAEPPSGTSGCEPSDFPAETEGKVVLIQRGTCSFDRKAQNAQDAGAVAALIFNEGQEGRTDVVASTLGEPGIEIPVVGISFDLGKQLFEADGARVSLDVEALAETRETSNVIAETKKGRADRAIVVGAHLDSVAEGPGINDNGSGSAITLETALEMANLNIKPANKVRFAFWGAEESGLLGSEEYVSNLSDDQLDQIALNLNFDMLGSPNFVRFVYDGNGSDTPEAGPAGSTQIERVFKRYFRAKNLPTEPTAFDGRSDYGPFIARGIPAGGLFTGAEGIKTEREASIYGGTAGKAYDSCYHQACDDITNLSIKALNQMSDATAHTTLTFAKDKSLFTGTTRSFKAQSSSKVYGKFKGPEARK